MQTRAVVAIIAALTVTVAGLALPAGAQGTKDQPKATEVGISKDEIRIAVVADDENPLSPGLFHGSPVAVKAFAKYVNSTGGLAGRKLVVDFLDSHLSADDARKAIIKACSDDFALVGTAALFLNNVDDMVECADKNGIATGLPDLAIVMTEIVQQCSPVSFGVNPGQLDCSTKDQHPQTFRATQGPIKYYQRTINKDLHGVFVFSNDLKSAAVAGLALSRGAQAGGVKRDNETGISALAPQSAFTPVVQQLKDAHSNYAFNGGPFSLMVALRKEAKLQGVNLKDLVWDCFSNCYDKRFIDQGGADVEGQYVTLAQLPFNESKSNKALANYIKFAGADNVDGFGAYAWIAGLLFRDSVNAIVQRDGVNGLTRAALLDQLKNTHAFDGDGMWGTTDIGNRKTTSCFVLMQVKNGDFVRVYPKKPGTFDCKKSNIIEIHEDLLGA